jgi:hypothetical protein
MGTEWNGSGWGILFNGCEFSKVDYSGVPLGYPIDFDDAWNACGPAFRFSDGMYGMAGSGDNGVYYAVVGAVLDGEGEPVSGIHVLSTDRTAELFGRPDITKCADEPGWLVTYDDRSGNVYVVHMDDGGRSTGVEWLSGEGPQDAEPVVISVCGLSSVIWYAWSGFRIRSFDWPDVEAGLDETIIVAPAGDYRYPRHTAVRYRDRIIMAYKDGRNVNVVAIDPWTGTVLGGPHAVGSSEREYDLSTLAPAEEMGYAAICYVTDEDDPEFNGGAVIRLVDADGRPIGGGLTIEGSSGPLTTYVGPCDITWSGSEFVVAYMRQGALEDPRWGLWVQRIRPLI